MDDLVERLRSKAQNDEMVDQHFTESGRLLNEAADEIERQQKRFADYALTCGRMLDEKDDEIERQREALRIGQAALETALNQVRDTQAQVAALTRERDEALENCIGHEMNAFHHKRERGAAEAQVAALRAALESLHALTQTLYASRLPADGESARVGEDVGRILSDTAAVARETERRLRIEGAEAMDERVTAEIAGDVSECWKPAAVVDAKWRKP